MEKLFLKYISRPFYSVSIIILLLFVGIWSLLKMPVNYFPGLNYPLINVTTQYPGIAPKDMEILVTRPIENSLQGLRGVTRTSSLTSMGISQVTVEFSNQYTTTEARQLTAAAISQLTAQLPSGITPVIDNLGSRMQQVIGFTFVNENIPITKLRAIIQYSIKPILLGLGNISKIDVMGGKREAYIIEPDISKLQILNLSLQDIQKKIKLNNIIVSGRYIENGNFDIPIRGMGQFQNISDIKNIRISVTKNNLPVYLKDVASVTKGGLPVHYIIKSSNIPAVALIIQKAANAGTIAVSKSVQNKLKQLQSILPRGTVVKKFYDQSEILVESINGVKSEMIIGALLAMLALFIFLRRLYPTLIISITIPLALMFAVIVINIFNYSFNMITLAALTLSLGMVVDDSIIVMEIIEKNYERGKDIAQSVVLGVKEIFAADLNGTVTTIIVFLPLFFITGYLSSLVIPFGFTIALTLTGSFIISITIIPALMHWKGSAKIKKTPDVKLLNHIYNGNNKILLFTIKNKKKIILFLFIGFIITAISLPILNKSDMLPEVDEGALLIEYVMRPGVSLKESNNVAEQLISVINKIPDVDNIYLKIGSPENTYYIETVNRGEFFIKLKQKRYRTQSVNDIIAELKKSFDNFKGVVLLYHQPTQEKIDESFSGLPAFFGVSIEGNNLDTLKTLADKFNGIIKNTGSFSNIINNSKYLVPQINVKPKRHVLAYYGLTANDMFQELAIAFRGRVVTKFVKEQVPISIFIRLPKIDRSTINQLRQLPIRTKNGAYIPLFKFADISINNILPTIKHLNGAREVALIASPKGNLFSDVNKLKSAVNKYTLPQGYTYEIRGQYQTLIESVKSFGLIIIAAIFLVYTILYLQFNSFWQPFVILFKIPLDFIGAFIFLLITRQALNISVGLGLLTLVGVSVNNAIILIDKINKLRDTEQITVLQATQEAVKLRTRPILMTGLTTILGLLPAAIGMGIGSKIHQPFAITIIGGMITGIFFSLNLIPVLYISLENKFKNK